MRYPGGKGKCFQHIINVLPKHTTYIETHLGGGAVLMNKAPAEESVAIDVDPKVIAWWRTHYPRLATFIAGNANAILQCYPFMGSEVVYCDPPYLPSTRKRSRVYANDLTEKDHADLLSILKRLPCRVAISGYPSGLYETELRDWNQIRFSAKGHDGVHAESLWINYTIPDELHDTRFLGANFRQRQDVKRRLSRLQNRVSRLSKQEQHALATWLSNRLGERRGLLCSISRF
jgi:site-specific DNA-adenine methylase